MTGFVQFSEVGHQHGHEFRIGLVILVEFKKLDSYCILLFSSELFLAN